MTPITSRKGPAAPFALLCALWLSGALPGCATHTLPPDGVVLHETPPEGWTPPSQRERPAAPSAPTAGAPGPPTARDLGRGLKSGALGVGRGVVTSASAVGRGTATAYRGVTRGFQSPEADAVYGPYPKRYAELVQMHFLHVRRTPPTARFKMDLPRRGYMNRGLLLGGGVAWQGWVVDVEVRREGGWGRDEPLTRRFAVRIRDDFVVDVHRGDGAVLHRLQAPARAER